MSNRIDFFSATRSPESQFMLKEALQIAEKRREANSEGEKERYIHEFQRRARKYTKAFLSDQCK